MKNMKRYILMFVVALLGLSFSACSLQEDPEDFINDTDFYKDDAQCEKAVNSVYYRLNGLFNYQMQIMTDAHTDLLYYGSSSTVDFAHLMISPAMPGFSATIWQYSYQMVMYANGVLKNLEKAPIKEVSRLRFMSETAIMRAFYYYLLTSTFGDVPFYTEAVDTDEAMNRIAKLPRMSAVDTRSYLINELNDYLVKMKEADVEFGSQSGYESFYRRTSEIKGNRAGAPMAMMLVAKMALWQAVQDTEHEPTYWYDVALTACAGLEAIYGDLGQYSYDDVMFRYKNTPESIFEIQHTYESGGLQYYSNLAAACNPGKKKLTTDEDGTKHATWDGVEIDIFDPEMTTWAHMHPTLALCVGLQTDGSEDYRAEVNMAWRYPARTGKEFNSVSTRPWMGEKFWCPNMFSTRDHNNYKVFRYADAVLIMAECYYFKQDYTNSVKYLNMVRNRAKMNNYTFKNDRKLFEEIRNERARELVGEFQRKYDLVRWGIWYEETVAKNDNTKLQQYIRPCHEYMPIPDRQVIYSGGALDNKAYNQYGM